MAKAVRWLVHRSSPTMIGALFVIAVLATLWYLNPTKPLFLGSPAKDSITGSAKRALTKGGGFSLTTPSPQPQRNASVGKDSRSLASGDYTKVLDIYLGRLTRFAREKRNLTAVTCDQLRRGDSTRPCYDPKCPGTFSTSPKDRLDQVLATRAEVPSKVRQALQAAVQNVTRHQYIFVSGVNSKYYGMLQALLENVFKWVFPEMAGKDFLLVIFDLGLTEEQRQKVKKHCRCTFVDFPFSELPQFVVELKCYAWKPLIVASLVEKAEYLVWMDSSIRWSQNPQFDLVFQRAKERGFQVYWNGGSIAVRTNPSMTTYFGDQLCQYIPFSEFEANLGVFYTDRFIKDLIVAPWVSCALNRTCMCLPNHGRMLWCANSPPRIYGRCHRFDQAALGILFSKLLLDQRPMVLLPPGVARVRRGHKADWFD